MEVRTLDARYRSREPHYQCASYVRRGTTVCANRLTLPAALAHEAVLGALESDVLHPDVVKTVIREAYEELRRPHTLDAAQGAGLKNELAALEQEMRNLTASLQAAGPLPSLVTALQAAEQRKAELVRTLTPSPVVAADVAKVKTVLEQWRETCRSDVAIGPTDPRAAARWRARGLYADAGRRRVGIRRAVHP
jgi:hypothetical protein